MHPDSCQDPLVFCIFSSFPPRCFVQPYTGFSPADLFVHCDVFMRSSPNSYIPVVISKLSRSFGVFPFMLGFLFCKISQPLTSRLPCPNLTFFPYPSPLSTSGCGILCDRDFPPNYPPPTHVSPLYILTFFFYQFFYGIMPINTPLVNKRLQVALFLSKNPHLLHNGFPPRPTLVPSLC